MLTMIGAINTFERENMLERQREGIAIAVQEGKYKGRKEIHSTNWLRNMRRVIVPLLFYRFLSKTTTSNVVMFNLLVVVLYV